MLLDTVQSFSIMLNVSSRAPPCLNIHTVQIRYKQDERNLRTSRFDGHYSPMRDLMKTFNAAVKDA